MSTVINCVSYEAGRRHAEVALAEACCPEKEGSFIWVGLHEPDKDLLRTVQQRFNLHDLAIEDALLAHQRPKLEVYGDSVFIALRTAQLVEKKINFGETHIFAGRGFVVTVRHGSTTAYREVRARAESVPKMLAMGESFVVYSVIDFIVDNYFPVLHELEAEADALEEEVFAHRSDLWNELQVNAVAGAALWLPDRHGSDDRTVRLPVLSLPACRLALERDRFILKRIRHLRSSLRTRLVRRSGGEHRSASRWLRGFAMRLYATRS